ncbi:MAG TPA: hypothetical protein PLN69_08720 [bacterium]|nr:hypothetical protein [bacterium]
MEFIAHRINTIDDLQNVPVSFGVELDLRDYGDRLVLNHDPFTGGEDFSLYLKHYRHGTMIINVKSEGVEYRALELLKENHIENFFFLDSSFPMIVRLGGEGENRLAVRYSEYEGIETVMASRGRAQWVWVDCFTTFPLEKPDFDMLKEAGFRVCLVSPELQAREQDIELIAGLLAERRILPDAICTKMRNIERWRAAPG